MGKPNLMRVSKLYEVNPLIKLYFEEYAIEPISEEMTLQDLTISLSDHWLRDHGLTREKIREQVMDLYNSGIKESDAQKHAEINTITVIGGFDKDRNPEHFSVTFQPGETVCICGATGSGKTRFLEDIEYLACGDSPTGRMIQVNGALPEDEEREHLESTMSARLSQSMNFVLELTCREFIALHAKCKNIHITDQEISVLETEIMNCANSLAGEAFHAETMITELSGGQSRSLMIADLAYISNAPVILIDEPENAGIDKDEILSLLASKGKIVLVSTHDPLIALSCKKRIIIKNGAISAVLDRTVQEKQMLQILKIRDRELKEIRDQLRNGKIIDKKVNYV